MKRRSSEVIWEDCETAPALILHCPSLRMLVSVCAHITRLTFPLIFSCEEFPRVTLLKLAGTISNSNVGLLLSGFPSPTNVGQVTSQMCFRLGPLMQQLCLKAKLLSVLTCFCFSSTIQNSSLICGSI